MNTDVNQSSGYNGYKNYQTWATALWLDNEVGSNDYLYELANRDAVYEATDIGVTTIPSKRSDLPIALARKELKDQADCLKEFVKDVLLDRQLNDESNVGCITGLGSDLLNHMIYGIDWEEIIVAHYE